MKTESLSLDGVRLITPTTEYDPRGLSLPVSPEVTVINAVPWALYGLYQSDNSRMINAVKGRVYVVVADLRTKEYVGAYLDDTDHKTMTVPAGYAYGFLVVGNGATVVVHTEGDSPSKTFRWNDPSLNVQWPLMLNMKMMAPVISQTDRAAPTILEDAEK